MSSDRSDYCLFAFRSIAALAIGVAGIALTNPKAIAKVFDAEPSSASGINEEQRLREGTKIEKVAGHFKLTGDRVTFYRAEDNGRFGGLENLALERISRTVKDSPTQLRWSVTGVITEYRGTNYLLVTHAVLTDDQKGLGGK